MNNTHCLLCEKPFGSMLPSTEEHVLPKWLFEKDIANARNFSPRDEGEYEVTAGNHYVLCCGECNGALNSRYEIPVKKAFLEGRLSDARPLVASWLLWVHIKHAFYDFCLGNMSREEFLDGGGNFLAAFRRAWYSNTEVAKITGMVVEVTPDRVFPHSSYTAPYQSISFRGWCVSVFPDGGYSQPLARTIERFVAGETLSQPQATELALTVAAHSTRAPLRLTPDRYLDASVEAPAGHRRASCSREYLLDRQSPFLWLLFQSGLDSIVWDHDGRFLRIDESRSPATFCAYFSQRVAALPRSESGGLTPASGLSLADGKRIRAEAFHYWNEVKTTPVPKDVTGVELLARLEGAGVPSTGPARQFVTWPPGNRPARSPSRKSQKKAARKEAIRNLRSAE